MATETETPEFDWGEVNGQAVERLRAPKIPPRPHESIVKQAQRSYDGVKVGDEVRHVLRHAFVDAAGNPDPAKATAFAKLVKDAQHFTTPLTTVSAVIDPDNTDHKHVVAWRAGARRGPKGQPA